MLIVLDSTTRKLQANLASGVSTQVSVVVAYADTTATTFTEGTAMTFSDGTAMRDILAAPASGTKRVVKSIMIFNNDAATQTINLYLDDNGTDYPLIKLTLGPGVNWASDDQTGVNVGGGVTDGNKGDIVVGSSGATWNIRTDMPGGAVTLAKMADLPTDRLIGRDSAGTGVPEAISVTGGIEFTGSGSLQVGAFSGEVGKTAGSSTLTITDGAVVTARLADAAVTPAKLSSVAQSLSFRNRLINGSFLVHQRGDTDPAGLGVFVSAGPPVTYTQRVSFANDTYCLDRWNLLTQSNNVEVTRELLTTGTIASSLRLKQTNATAQQAGVMQIIEDVNCQDLRGRSIILSGQIRSSASRNMRVAILEWTGTANGVNSLVVDTWGPPITFKGTTQSVLAQTTVTTSSTSSTWTSFTLSATVGSSANNLIVFVGADTTMAQNATFDLATFQLEAGTTATAFEVLPIDVEQYRCRRYFQHMIVNVDAYNVVTPPRTDIFNNVILDPMMRTVPTVTIGTPTLIQVNCNGLELWPDAAIDLNSQRQIFFRAEVLATGRALDYRPVTFLAEL
jgi:hypothetical protein